MWNTADQTAAGQLPGVSQPTYQAQGFFQGMLPGAQTGMGALSGNAQDLQKLMNPYQSEVINAQNQQFANNNAQVANQVNSNATAQGAFGGDRAAVAQGAALGTAQTGENNTIANLLSGGYQQAMQQAGQLANLGFGAGSQLNNIGQYETGVAQQQFMNPYNVMRGSVMATPFQGTQTQQQNPSPWSTALGDVTTGAGLVAMM
ncbi:MAG TPA: hypothetical protein VFA81_04045 [Burkholderiales bacterium]|nr:hypothetical protein [Burkholderiales bacterium]